MQRFGKYAEAARGDGQKHFQNRAQQREPIDPSAAICLTELGERVMRNPRRDYTMAPVGMRCRGIARRREVE